MMRLFILVVSSVLFSSCLGEYPPYIYIEWVTIEGGDFMMGSELSYTNDNAKPVHPVTVPTFQIMKTEVTIGMYRACVEAGRCTEPDTTNDYYCNWCESGREDHPISSVDWGQARTFAKWVGADVDLPTEAEWEYAARGGQNYKYAGSNDVDDVAWYEGGTKPVGTKRANGYGLHDMSGNVSEWVLDEYSSYVGAPNDGSKARGSVPSCSQVCNKGSARRVVRGGSSGGCPYGNCSDLHVAARSSSSPDVRYYRRGFRLRRTVHLDPLDP